MFKEIKLEFSQDYNWSREEKELLSCNGYQKRSHSGPWKLYLDKRFYHSSKQPPQNNKYHLLSDYYVACTLLSALYVLSHLYLTIILLGSYNYCIDSVGEDIEA